MAPGHLVLARARAQAPVLAATAVLLLVATGVLVAVVAFADGQATQGLRRAVRDLPPSASVATVRARQGDDPAAQHSAVVEDVERLGGDAPLLVTRTERSSLLTVTAPATDGRRTVAVAYDDLPAHADLTAGAWPDGGDPLAATLHADAAETLGVAPGDSLVVEGADGPVALAVTGTWRPRDAADPFFAGDPLETTGAESPTISGPVVVPDLAAAGLDPRPTVRWRVTPDAERVRPADLAAVTSAAQRLRATVSGDPRVGADVQVAEGLAAVTAELSRRVVVARSVAVLPALVVAVLAGLALLLVARLLTEVRAGQTALVRARGASATQVGAWAALEGVALAVPVALVAPPLGVALASATGVDVVLTPALWWTGAAVAVAGAALVLAPSLRAAREWSVVAPARARRTELARRGTDVALLAAAAVAVWQLRRHGTALAPESLDGNRVSAVDPLLVAAPALALLAGGVLAARLLPFVARPLDRVMAGRRGLPVALTVWEASRRPASYALPAVLVAVSVATGVLAAGYSATWRGLQEDAAVQRTGADVRVSALSGSRLPAAERTAAYAGVDGVEAVTAGAVDEAAVSSASLTLLALDARTAPDVVRVPTGAAVDGADLADVVRADGTGDGGAGWPGFEVPPGATSAQVEVALSQEGFDPGWASRGGAQVGLAAWVGDPDGSLTEVRAAPVDLAGGARSVVLDLPLAGTGPWTLVALDVSAASLPGQRVAYRAAVEQVTVDGAAVERTGTAWQELATSVPAGLSAPEVLVAAGGLPEVTLTTSGSFGFGQVRTRLGPPELDGGPVPAVLTRELAEAADAAVGDVLTVSRRGVATPLLVRAVEPALPGAGGAAALVDLQALTGSALARAVAVPAVDEWWISTAEDAATGDVVEALRSVEGARGEVVAADLLAEDAAADPLGGASTGAFDLAIVAAVGLAGTGIAVAAAAVARRRRAEVATLRATGVTAGQVRGLLAGEQVVVAVLAAVAGLALGAAVSMLTLPYLVVPPGSVSVLPVVRFSAGPVLGVLAGVALAVGVAVAARWVTARRRPPAADVRLGADL